MIPLVVQPFLVTIPTTVAGRRLLKIFLVFDELLPIYAAMQQHITTTIHIMGCSLVAHRKEFER